MPHRLPMLYYLRFKRTFRRIARSAGTPEHIALGAALGMLIAMLPIVGLQMVVATAICLVFRANPLPAVVMVWITNPFTILPVYTFNYWVGTMLVRSGPRIAEFRAHVKEIVRLANEAHFSDGLSALARMGWDIQLPLWTGCFAVGALLGIPTYFLTRRAVVRIRVRVAQRRAARETRLFGLAPEQRTAAGDGKTPSAQSSDPQPVERNREAAITDAQKPQ